MIQRDVNKTLIHELVPEHFCLAGLGCVKHTSQSQQQITWHLEMMALTSIVAHDEIHIGPKLERAKQMVTHEILQSDAFNEANIALEIHAEDNIQPLMSW